LQVQLTQAETAQLIIWRIVEPHNGRQDTLEPKVRCQVGPMVQGRWASAPLPSLAA
jgi:hypothetical protein